MCSSDHGYRRAGEVWPHQRRWGENESPGKGIDYESEGKLPPRILVALGNHHEPVPMRLVGKAALGCAVNRGRLHLQLLSPGPNPRR